MGAFTVASASGMPLEDAIQFANGAGALATQGVGAQPSIPKRDAILALRGGAAGARCDFWDAKPTEFHSESTTVITAVRLAQVLCKDLCKSESVSTPRSWNSLTRVKNVFFRGETAHETKRKATWRKRP